MGKVLRTGRRIAPFLQVHTQQAGDRGVVLDDEDPMHGSDVSFPKEELHYGMRRAILQCAQYFLKEMKLEMNIAFEK